MHVSQEIRPSREGGDFLLQAINVLQRPFAVEPLVQIGYSINRALTCPARGREFILHGKEANPAAPASSKSAATAEAGQPAADTIVAPAAPAGASAEEAARSLAAAAAAKEEVKQEREDETPGLQQDRAMASFGIAKSGEGTMCA